MSATPKILLLGGTTEASALARMLAQHGIATILSYAGRTEKPRSQPVPIRIGGFGGIDGLTRYLREHGISHLVDATHPFAATMSHNSVEAARQAGIAHAALTRPAWLPQDGDSWSCVPDLAGVVSALAGSSRRIMLALGRMHVDAFAAQPQHHYLLRFVDRPDEPPRLPQHSLIVDRGPFDVEGELALMRDHGTDLIICKNSGGSGAEAKLIAARQLGLPVLMIDRPQMPDRIEFHRLENVLSWLGHDVASVDERGV